MTSLVSPQRILVATRNRHKLEEIQAALSALRAGHGGARIMVVGPGALAPSEAPQETGATFRENARLKAVEAAVLAARLPPSTRPTWSLGDDSGLAVDALGGEPGVRSARYAGEGASDQDNNRKLLDALAGVPREGRGAEFICMMALVRVPDAPTGTPDAPPTGGAGLPVAFYAEGRSRGEILREESGRGGFGYDPLFYVPELEKTFAELTTAEKNEVSHRGRALKAFVAELERHLDVQ
ncbi:MAG TPA: non-canonical purine NTP pyrophosphatase [Planctomycetota bacterium]|nr:non-canonical purine NTP pyrophosphatase [Planctomycetota bacterium]